tara:strand:- start:17 stop:250 length:234 start_codon:yes stop_codon:yes gene_type:complete
MDKNQYKKYINKYCKCDLSHFVEDMTLLHKNKIGFKHKGVNFMSLNKDEYSIYNNWSLEEQTNFLNGYWNFFMSIND